MTTPVYVVIRTIHHHYHDDEQRVVFASADESAAHAFHDRHTQKEQNALDVQKWEGEEQDYSYPAMPYA
jgi:hypothetical protein